MIVKRVGCSNYKNVSVHKNVILVKEKIIYQKLYWLILEKHLITSRLYYDAMCIVHYISVTMISEIL